MITERQIRKLMEEHIDDININISVTYEVDNVTARVNFLAGAIAIMKLINRNDLRFINQEKLK